MLSGLIFGCPHGKSEEYCPLAKYHQQSPLKSLDEIDQLSPEEKADLEQFHHQCCLFRDAYVFSKKYD